MKISPIRTDESCPFAHGTMSKRLPGLIDDLQHRNDFTKSVRQNLTDLQRAMINNAPMPEPRYLAPDATIWMADYEAHRGETWLDTEWFFGEMFFFREVINRVQYWQTGRDPYYPVKSEELYSDGLQQQLAKALAFEGTPAETLNAMLHFALWGNRADLSLPEAMAHGQTVSNDDLLIDDSDVVVPILLKGQNPVHIITDNFGTELAMDFALIYHLLGLDIPVIVHVKMNPTYVSDATSQDIRWMLGALPEISPDFVPLSERLKKGLDTGQLKVCPDFFWNSSRYYDNLPQHLRLAFSQARIILSKGDANYRRALYDTVWAVNASFVDINSEIQSPFLALRTLKSDPIVGLSMEQAQMLDTLDVNWRTNGKRGIIQFQ